MKVYSYGYEAVVGSDIQKKYNDKMSCMKDAAEAGHSFIVEQNGKKKKILSWGAKAVSRKKALELFSDSPKKIAIIKQSYSSVWIVAPVIDDVPLLFPFEGDIVSFCTVAEL